MIAKKSVLGLSREEWLDERKKGIGGSDAATVMGLNPFSSKLHLYADKKGLIPEREDNEQMKQGRDLEDYGAQRWMEATGKKVRRNNHILYNDEYPFAFANIDREVVGERSVLEIKTTSVYNKTDFQGGEIPPYYYVQVMHYLAVTGYERAYLAVLVLNKGFYEFTIERNQGEIDALMEAEKDFWENHVLAGVEPAPDGSDSSMEVLKGWDRTDGTEILVGADELFDELEMTDTQLKDLNKYKEQLRQTLIQQLGNKTRGEAMRWSCSYLPQIRTSVDTDTLKTKYPQAYAECQKTSQFSTFRTKKNRENN